jgi:hypothetical protein
VPRVGPRLERLGSGTEVDVHSAEKDLAGAVKLNAGLDREVTGKDDLSPRAGAIRRRREAEIFVVEVVEKRRR